jgi:hypothetical protein
MANLPPDSEIISSRSFPCLFPISKINAIHSRTVFPSPTSKDTFNARMLARAERQRLSKSQISANPLGLAP